MEAPPHPPGSAPEGDPQADSDRTRDQIRHQMSADDPADVAVTAVDELAAQAADIERLTEEKQALQAQLAEAQDQLLRRAAEFQNYRRRSESDRQLAEDRARDGVLLPVLDVFDDLRRSLDAARRAAKQDAGTASFDALSQGVELVYQKFEDTLARIGVTAIETVGQPFDENLHEAVMQQPATDDAESGTVLAEIQRGYRIGDRVLRHARVIVAQ